MVMAGPSRRAPRTRRPASCKLCDASGFPSCRWSTAPGTWSALPLSPMRWSAGLTDAGRGGFAARAARRGDLASRVWLGHKAMCGGGLHEPLLTVAWPGAHLGRWDWRCRPLGLRKELEANRPTTTSVRSGFVRPPRPRRRMPGAQRRQLFEIDDVIDPADTPHADRSTLAAAGTPRIDSRDRVSSTPGSRLVSQAECSIRRQLRKRIDASGL